MKSHLIEELQNLLLSIQKNNNSISKKDIHILSELIQKNINHNKIKPTKNNKENLLYTEYEFENSNQSQNTNNHPFENILKFIEKNPEKYSDDLKKYFFKQQ